jgi:hypothetical protein
MKMPRSLRRWLRKRVKRGPSELLGIVTLAVLLFSPVARTCFGVLVASDLVVAKYLDYRNGAKEGPPPTT